MIKYIQYKSRNGYFNILVVAVLNSYDQVFTEDW